jgi:perosamine synthetase
VFFVYEAIKDRGLKRSNASRLPPTFIEIEQTLSDLPAILGGDPVTTAGPPVWPPQLESVQKALEAVFSSGNWGRYHGLNCKRLGEALADYHDVEFVQLCSSGTVGIELALRGAKVGVGDEVILAAYDFKANMQDVLAIGAVPVLVDLDPKTWQLDVTQIESAITDKTKAIIASHLHGGLVDMTAVMAVAESYEVTVVEDACQNPGAIVNGRVAGTTGHVGVLSFGGSKLLTAGRGGAVLTNRSDINQRIRLYTQRGNDCYPLSELQAAVLLPQLERLDQDNAVRLANIKTLNDQIGESQLITPMADFSTRNSTPTFYKFGVQLNPSSGLSRTQFSKAMRAEGIAFDPGFDGLHRTHSKRRFRAVGELAVADAAHKGCVVLHHPVLLGDASGIEQCAIAVKKIETHATAISEQVTSC